MCKAAEELFRQDVRHIVCVTSECENWQQKALPAKCGMLKNILEAAQYLAIVKIICKERKQRYLLCGGFGQHHAFIFFVARHNQLFYLLLWTLLHPFNLLHI